MRKRPDTQESQQIDDGSVRSDESSVRPKAEVPRGRVLVIDDSLEARSFIATVLSLHGFNVLQVESGEQGLSFYRALHAAIDAVVLDMQMPGMDGAETFRELRRVNPAVKVILCSGGFPSSLPDVTLQQAALACLPKPFDPDELIETLVVAVGSDRER